MYTKKEVSKLSVPEVLKLVYEREIHEASITHVSKENLEHFILEIFNKGILNNYLSLH